MNELSHQLLKTFVLAAAMLCLTQTARAQDPAKVDPDHYKVLKETDTVRILEYRDTPGHKVPRHSHPSYFVYVLDDATRLFTDNCITPKTVTLKAGETLNPPAVIHCEQNTGNTNTHLLIVEFKRCPDQSRTIAEDQTPVMCSVWLHSQTEGVPSHVSYRRDDA